MRCVLHIGTEKTGTTLLQEWLYANQARLGRKGVVLSRTLGGPNNFYISEFFQSYIDIWALEAGISTLAEKNRFFLGFEKTIEAEFREAAKRFDTFVITSEFLHSRLNNRADIRALKKFLLRIFSDVRVVCYFREQCSMATSLYTTAVLRDCALPLERFLDEETQTGRYYYEFLTIADNWSAVFGRENCDFRAYDRTHFLHGDIRKDFLEAVDPTLTCDGFDFAHEKANASMHALQAVAIVKLNRLLPFFFAGTRQHNHDNMRLKGQLLRIPELRRGRLASSDPARVWQRFENSNRAFFDRYFEGKDIFAESRAMQLAQAATAADISERDCERAEALAAGHVRNRRLVSYGSL